MMWLALAAAAIWLGFESVPLLGVRTKTILHRLLLGWLVGSIANGCCAYVTNYFVRLSAIHSLFHTLVSCIIAFHIRRRFGRRLGDDERRDRLPWLAFVLLFVGGITLKYLAAIYQHVPFEAPILLRPFIDDEVSFIERASVRRRRSLFFYDDARVSDRAYGDRVVPLLFVGMLTRLGASYADASIFVCFMNVIATTYSLFWQANNITVWPWFATLVVLFNGSSATWLFLFGGTSAKDVRNDLVNRIAEKHETMGFQFLFHLLCFSKSTSYTIALTQYAVCEGSALLAALIPSFPASFGVFMSLVYAGKWSDVFPYCLTVVGKILPFRLQYNPLFREEVMRGTFFSSVKIWFDVFGPVQCVLVLIYFGAIANLKTFPVFMSCITGVCFLEFVRDGSRFNNVAGVCAFFGPVFLIASACCMRMLRVFASRRVHYGGFTYIMWVLFAYVTFGGLLCGWRTAKSASPCMDRHGWEAVEWIKKEVAVDEVVLVGHRLLHPVIFTGRRMFLGDIATLYKAGVSLNRKIRDFEDVISPNVTEDAWSRFGISCAVEEVGQFELDTPRIIIASNDVWRLVRLA